MTTLKSSSLLEEIAILLVTDFKLDGIGCTHFNMHKMSFLFLQKCEDSDLIDAKPLPPCKPVNVPMEITAEMFGDIAMIADFVHTFCDLLAPRETLHISIGKYQNID